jgi:hypothetical protein
VPPTPYLSRFEIIEGELVKRVLGASACGAGPDQPDGELGAVEHALALANKAHAAIEPSGIRPVARVGRRQPGIFRREEALAREQAVSHSPSGLGRKEDRAGEAGQRPIGPITRRKLARRDSDPKPLGIMLVQVADEGVIFLHDAELKSRIRSLLRRCGANANRHGT